MSRHRELMDAAVRRCATDASRLQGAAVCVTGASGFLAASLVAFLSELNRQANLGLRLHANARRPINDVPLFAFLDLTLQVEWTVGPVETVPLPPAEGLILVHTASYGSPRDYQREPIATFRANTQALVRLFEEARHPQQFVYFSSAEIYGQPPDRWIPTPETYVGGLDTLAARSIYGESKRVAETLGACLGEQKHVPFTVLRPWNAYGPGQRLDDGRVPIEFIRQARQTGGIRLASNGTPRRAFCFVWDAIEQIVATLGRTERVAAYNIGNSTEEISIREAAEQCAVACGLPTSAVSFDARTVAAGLQRCAPDTTAVQQLRSGSAGFVMLAEGLRVLAEWHDFVKR